MPIIKTYKAEKVSSDVLAEKALNVVKEMMSIIVDRASREGEDDSLNVVNSRLHYFGEGQQLKISKVADSLYSSLKDVLGYVMVEMAKNSESDCKFQMPKHTCYIGTIVKNTTIDVIARNPQHQEYLNSLVNQTGKYRFDVTSHPFQTLYYDTVLKLFERGYLFDDDPELDEVKQLLSQGIIQGVPDASGSVSISLFMNANEGSLATAAQLTTRNRVIFPYIRRLFETQKAALVTKKRVELLNDQIRPDEEIRRIFQQKYDEAMVASNDNSLNVAPDVIRAHCQFLAFNFLKDTFPKDRVEQLRNYLRSERSINTRSHKRYITIPSSKRARTDEFMIQYGEEEGDDEKMQSFQETFNQTQTKVGMMDTMMNAVMMNGGGQGNGNSTIQTAVNEMLPMI